MSDQKKAFFADLAILLNKHHAQIEVRPGGDGDCAGIDIDLNSLRTDKGEYECIELDALDTVDVEFARKLAND